MKKILIIPLLLFTFFLQAQTLAEKNRIVLAIYKVETESGKHLHNPTDTLSKGHLQERDCYVNEANRILGYKRFDYNDVYNFNLSVLIMFTVVNFWVPDWNWKKVALLHCCWCLDESKASENALKYVAKVDSILNK